MGFLETGTDIVLGIFDVITEGLLYTKSILAVVLDVNNVAMSKLWAFLWNLGNAVAALTNLVVLVVYTVFVYVLDFLVELGYFTVAFLHLLWKLLILFCSLVDVIFQCLECILIFLWTGGQWTAKTIHISSRNLADNGIGTWKYFVLSIKELTNSLIGGFTTVGVLSKELCLWIFSILESSYEYLIAALNYADNIVRTSIIYVFDQTYHCLTDYILNMPKEAYLGILIFIASFFTINSIFHSLCNRGLTFPLFSMFREHLHDNDSEDYDDDYDGRMAEFSDDDLIDLTYDDEDDDVSRLTDSTDEDGSDDDDDDEELEVNSSDDESVAESESEMSEINIELPEINGHRRSTTPSRWSKEMSPSGLKKAIENETERRMCVVCQDQTKSVLILPCRHMCLCVDCGNQIARTRIRNRRVCPLCRTKIRTIMNVYI